jgi:hypothetical protein
MNKLKEETENSRRIERCLIFDSCEAPKCPLDELSEHRVSYSGDPKCTLNKRMRYLLGKRMKHCGMTPKEWDGYLRTYKSEQLIRDALVKEFGD